jgi:hypothetical protein
MHDRPRRPVRAVFDECFIKYPRILKKMKQTDYSWIWIGALGGLTLGIASDIYNKKRMMDEYARLEKIKYTHIQIGLRSFIGAKDTSTNNTKKRTAR